MKAIGVVVMTESSTIAFPLLQGLSQDSKTAGPTQRRFQNKKSNPFWGLVFTPVANPEVTRCSAKKRNAVQWKRPWSAIIAATAYEVTKIHTFRKQYKDFY